MLRGWVIAAASLAYVGVLFAVAHHGDRRAERGRSIVANGWVYALSLAVYCSTWTFYGSVGRAASTGLGFLPVYLGPTLTMALGWQVVRKIVRITKAQRITSIADFVASRYGKSHALGGAVTLVAVVGIVPYLALQLKAISSSFETLSRAPQVAAAAAPLAADSALWIAVLLAAFAILFGARQLDATERHEGLVAAIALESLVKLVAFVTVGAFVTFGVHGGLGPLFARARASAPLEALLALPRGVGSAGAWASVGLVSMLAVVLLPRQFQVAAVENVDEEHLRRAIWVFPLYLLAINVFVLPVALAGRLEFPGGVDADAFVLTLPMAHGAHGLALLAFLGGLSAGTGMVIVETIALSTMVCNDLVMPLLLRQRWVRLAERRDVSGLLLGVRRAAIAAVLALAYLYYRAAGEAYALVGIGLISFAAVAQFAPALLGGLYWKGATRGGAMAGLCGGFAVWAYTLLFPSFARSGWLGAGFVADGPFRIALLRPQALFGLTGLDEIAHALFWSMLVNVGLYVAVSLAGRPGVEEERQADLFVDAFDRPRGRGARHGGAGARVEDLLPLIGRFLGPERAREALLAHARRQGLVSIAQLRPGAQLASFAEAQLAGAIGGASARVVIASVAREEPPALEEVMDILDEASQARAHSHELEEKSRALEAATRELRAANARLQELDRLKDDFMSSVTHELRTPLTAIRALSEILRDDPRTRLADRERFLGVIVKEAERLSRLINQLLEMAKIESGRAEWRASEVDVAEVAREAAEATGQLFRERGVELALSPGAAPPVHADRDRLMQVLVNLLSNAVKFSPAAGGRVRVRVRAEGAAVRVDVEDNGPGVRPEDRERIFDKFRQGGDATGGKPMGTGLGLAISRRIVEHLGGRLWVEGAPGGGALFSFVLPLAAPAQGASAAAEGAQHHG